jgi:NTP pyrophosphatase (non-canonical NTP hydrolase)
MKISVMQEEAWRIAEEKGFHVGRDDNSRDDTLIRLCLIHSEVSEAVDEVKKRWAPLTLDNARVRVAEELADVLIRCGDLAQCIGVDLQQAVVEKLKKNEKRPKGYGTPNEGRAGGI